MTSKEDMPNREFTEEKRKSDRKDAELPPSGTSLHKRRRGEPPATLSVRAPLTPSDAEGSSPCTAGLSPDDWSTHDDIIDPESFCESMIQRLKNRDDIVSKQGIKSANQAKEAFAAVDQIEKLMELLDQFVSLKEKNENILKKLRDVEQLKKLFDARKKIREETEKLKAEEQEIHLINEALDAELGIEYGQVLFDNLLYGGRSMKRTGSKWKGHSRFGGSLLRKQRSRSAGGEDSDASPGIPLRRRSEGIYCKDVDKSKVSKWTRVKAAFRWEKAHLMNMGGAASSAVAAGALVGAVALAGSAPSSAPVTLTSQDAKEYSLTPRSTMSLTPNTSSEELRMAAGMCRKNGVLRDENDNSFLQAPAMDDSSTSPSPNKLHKTPWSKMRDILQTHRESVRRKSRGSKNSPDVVPRRRSFSDGGDSDAPPVLTLTIPSSEELESEPHPLLRKQKSLELSARPPQHRPPRASKWSKVKKAFLTTASASVPSSPSRHSAFFTDADTEALSSGCEASSAVREEIARDYAALQSRLTREFSDRRGKLYAEARPVATEEQLSADFRKKLAEWQRMKGVRQPPPIPARQDLSDDFLKRWDEWKRMKETNSVPAWEEEAKPDEVLVQTSTGLFRFQGVTRSFTRKLHEWEKSRGIAPEASTSALLRAAKSKSKLSSTPLTRTQSDGSVAPSCSGSGRLHASSLSVNDADRLDLEYDGDRQYISNLAVEEEEDAEGDHVRGAVLVEVEDEEVCTAAPLVAMTPRHTPQKPVYTYGHAEARLLCETTSAVTGMAIMQPSETRGKKQKDQSNLRTKSTRDQSKSDKSHPRRKLARQLSLEDDAKFIRKTIEEIERGSSSRLQEDYVSVLEQRMEEYEDRNPEASTSKVVDENDQKDLEDQSNGKDEKRKDAEKIGNGKKKSKSRARLERELSKPSESDTELDVDTVTVEIPRRRKRPRRPSEKPKTPPASIHSDSEQEVFVLKLEAPRPREGSPEVIVKTTRKIFSPVVRCGETVPRAVIPLDVEELVKDTLTEIQTRAEKTNASKNKNYSPKVARKREEMHSRSKSSGDIPEVDDIKSERKDRPPLPLSPKSQRKPQAKETAPSIRIMIQRYNLKINEEGHTSGASSGTSSPAWRSPTAERRRPPDMPVGVNIRNNPFLEKEVQKSASACQLSRRDQSNNERRLSPTPENLDGVLKSHSANVLLSDKSKSQEKIDDKRHAEKIENDKIKEKLKFTPALKTARQDITPNLQIFSNKVSNTIAQSSPNMLRQLSCTPPPINAEELRNFERSISVADSNTSAGSDTTRVSERTAKIREAKEKFLTNSVLMRKNGTSSTSDLSSSTIRPNRVSCEFEMAAAQSSRPSDENSLNRSASTGMVNVDRTAWERVAEGRKSRSAKSKFSLSRLAAKLRKKDEGAVSRLCRQSLLVQLRGKP